jgi:glycerol uptake facilitator-like aquaporin
VNSRAIAAEALGSAGLLAVVVGSGIMGERLALGNDAIALLANSLATAAALFVLIVALGPVSGAHFNPVVTLAAVLCRELRWRDLAAYSIAQLAGAVLGVWIAHAMFALPIVQVSSKVRWGAGQWIAEFVAAFGLVACIRLCARHGLVVVAAAVACYIGAAYWFTASTSFANPAVTIARALTDSFAGIHPAGVAPFIAAQIAGALVALGATKWFEG